jgi:hypothetical protein
LLNWYSNLSNSKKEKFTIADDGMKIKEWYLIYQNVLSELPYLYWFFNII